MDDDQVKQDIKEIRSRLSSASSPAELERLSIDVGKLPTSGISPEVEKLVTELQIDLEKRVKEAEVALSSKIYTGNEARVGNDEDRDKDFDRIAAENDKIYKAFDDTHEEQLARKQARAKNLSEVLKAIEGDNPISETLKKQLEKDDTQKKEEREHHKKMAEAMKASKAENERHKAAIKEIDSEIRKPSQSQEKIQALQKRRKQHTDRLDVVNGVVQKGNAELDACIEQAEFIHRAKKVAKKEEDQTFLAEQERDWHSTVFAAFGEDTLLEHVQKGGKEKDRGKMEALLDLIESSKSTADGLKGALSKGQKDEGLSHTPLRPSNTPNVKVPASNKGHGI